MAIALDDHESRKVHDHYARTRRTWSDAEKALVRKHYGDIGAKGLLALLPTRSFGAITGMAKELGVQTAHWSDAEHATLRKFFGMESMSEIAKRIGRSANTCAREARRLGLTHKDMTQGYVTIAQACRVHGFSWSEMRRVLRYAGLNGIRLLSEPDTASKAERGVRRYYPTLDVEEAVEGWRNTETPGEAAARLGATAMTLRKWLRDAGIGGDPNEGHKGRTRREWRIPRETLDRVVIERVRADTLVTAAQRHGIDPQVIAGLFEKAGIKRELSVWLVSPEKVDAICAAYWRRRAEFLERVAAGKARIHARVVRAHAAADAGDKRRLAQLTNLRRAIARIEAELVVRGVDAQERSARIARRAEEAAAARREVEAARAHFETGQAAR